MKKLDKQAEDRLLAAIEKTAALVNDGVDPNEAIAKSAQDGGIPPGHINLMVHAYNTGRTTRQRQDGHDPLDKAANFQIASAERVLELLYPSKVKSAAARQRETAVSLEYAVPPTGLLARRARRETLKQAQSIDWKKWAHDGVQVEASDPGPLPSCPAETMKRAYCEAERLQREVNEARRLEAAAMDKMAHVFMELTEQFRRPGAPSLATAREHAGLLHGAKGQQLIDELAVVTPGIAKLACQKQARVSNYSTERADGEIYGLISEFLDSLDEYRMRKQAHVETLRRNAEKAEALLRPFAPGRPQSVLGEGSSREKAANMGLQTLLGASAIKNLMPESRSSAAENVLADLHDPAHEAALKNIRTRAMLQDLMTSDPVISSHDPAETMGAFNDIVQSSPRSADQRLVMQSLLRKQLEQGALDPFDVELMLGLEEKQKKINAPTPSPALSAASKGPGGASESVIS